MDAGQSPGIGQISDTLLVTGASGFTTRELPGFFVNLTALFDPTLKAVVPDIGNRPDVDASSITDLTGVRFRPAEESGRAAAPSPVDQNLA